MQVSAVQLLVTEEEPPAQRVDRALQQIANEADRGADLVMLPEMWYPGYFGFDDYEPLAEPLTGALPTRLAEAAANHHVNVLAGSIAERSDDGRLHNTSLLLSRTGDLVASYRKVHLFPYGSREAELLTAGTSPVVAELEGTRVGLSTCYDLRYPELYRAMVDDGAEVFLVVAGWPFPRLDAWRILGRARAIENQAAVIGCNTSGSQAGATFLGASYAFDAWGTPLGELDDRPATLRVAIDTASITAAREDFPALAGRRLPLETP